MKPGARRARLDGSSSGGARDAQSENRAGRRCRPSSRVRGANGAPAPGPAGALSVARLAGSSVAGHNAGAWVTDFLNAAYYRRDAATRDVDDLRLAFAILTTYWHRTPSQRCLRVTDLPAFHRAFGHERFSTADSARGTLTREQLFAGATRLLGGWFPAAYVDARRRGWGVVFETEAG